jgi:hypothetical protein
MRELTSHKINGLNEALKIQVLDKSGEGNICYVYRIAIPRKTNQEQAIHIEFQNGTIEEFGVNGISNEALLAIVEDRLIGFQSGNFGSPENSLALSNIQQALHWLKQRTSDRVARGVDGKNQK